MNKNLTPYELRRQQEAQERARQQRFDLQIKGKLEQTVKTAEATALQQEIQRTLKQEEDFKDQVRHLYIQNNGGHGANGFEEAWPKLREAIVQQQTLAGFAESREGDTPAERVLRAYGRT